MTDKRFDGIEIMYSSILPVELLNEKTNEKEIVHMIQNGNTIFVSEELFNALKRYGDVE